MVPKKKIDEILDGYDPNDITIATLCSHSSLQIFHGARKMGFKTLGITISHDTRYYDAFPLGKPIWKTSLYRIPSSGGSL